jgi:hypothetical protein
MITATNHAAMMGYGDDVDDDGILAAYHNSNLYMFLFIFYFLL